MTAHEWYTELADRDTSRVWEAVRRLSREQPFRPALSELLDTAKAIALEQAPSILAIEAPDRPGVPPPLEAKRALDVILRRAPLGPDQPERSREQQLAELEAMMAAEEPEEPELSP